MPQPPPESTAPDRVPPWAVSLARVLDDAFTIPGTHMRIGLDAILGFFLPTIGDAATGLCSLSLLVLGFQMGVPRVVLLRMVFNIALDTLLGSIPFVGDVFDLFWRSNRRNLELLRRYDRDPARPPGVTDYLIVGMGITLVIAAVVLPLLLGFAVLRFLWRQVSAGG
ncbi:MAG: DUF4112 domain-containing protein [Pseudomonadota bacterium]